MKKLLTAVFFCAALTTQSHADDMAKPKTAYEQALMYSTMSVDNLYKAAKTGEQGAQFYLGMRYQHGLGVKQDLAQAFAWYKKSADGKTINMPAAQLNVGRMLVEGQGVKKDINAGKRYLELSARGGDNRASYNLGLLEEQNKNYQTAYQWYELSTREGMLDNKVATASQTRKVALAANLTTEQMRTAHNRAYEWWLKD